MALPPAFHASDEDIRRMILEQQRGRGPVTSMPAAFSPTPAPPPVQPRPVTPQAPVVAAPRPAPVPAQPPVAAAKGTPTKEPGWLETIFGAAARGAGNYEQAKEGYRKEALRDPGSAESASLRQRMGPMLAQLGLRPDELAQLSGEDLQAVAGKGDLIAGVLEARQKAALAKQKAAADEAALKEERAYKEAQDKAQRAADAAEWDRQNAIEAPQRLERARTIGGMATGRMIQGALLQDELQRGRASEAEQRRIAAEGREESRKVRESKAKAEQDAETKLINEELSLDKLEQKLTKRDPNEALPGQGNIVERGIIGAKAKVAGGSGMSPEDTSLDTDLTAAGLQAYIGTAGNAPNSEREQNVAATLFRGNGTVGSALQRVRERKAEIARKKAALKARVGAAVGGTPATTLSDDPDEADLGTSYE